MVSGEGLQNQFAKLKKAFNSLKDAAGIEKNEYIRDSVIKRFEFTFELLWKLLKRLGESENLECYSPKSCFKLAYQMGLINNEEIFLSMLEYRNLTAHTYNENDAEAVYEFIKQKGIEAFDEIIGIIYIRFRDD